MTSMRVRLFGLIAAVTVLVWAGAAVWTAVSTRTKLEHVLDRRLMEAARMVAALDVPVGNGSRPLPPPAYSHQLSCQIWSLAGALIGQSVGAPASPLASGAAGFSERLIDGRVWRVYTHVDETRGIRVMVGDNLEIRQRLVRDLMIGLLLPAAIGLVVLGLLVWLGIRQGLRPLARVADALHSRSPESLSPLTVGRMPDEVKPIVSAMNSLLSQLENARSAERDFVANAAHEMQTPLAGLKTQAEVARRATSREMRDNALEHIAASVDRTSRLVRQLLELAREQGRVDREHCQYTRLASVITETADTYGPRAIAVFDAEADASTACDVEVALDREGLRLAIGNLVENALNHGGEGFVRIDCAVGDVLEIRVVDQGEGIPKEEIDRVRRRFERGRQARTTGTGLGLAIVEAAIAPAHGTLAFMRLDAGFAAILRFPLSQVRSATPDGRVIQSKRS